MKKTIVRKSSEQHRRLPAVFSRFLILLLLFSALFAHFSIPTFARQTDSATGSQLVRVGYYYSRGFQEGAEDGSPKTGYAYEYLQKVASYTGWTYEYVYGTWDELYQKLVDGDIDLMAGIAYNQERDSLLCFPDADLLKETFYIYKSVGNDSIQSSDISSYSGKRIGTTKDPKMSARILQWRADTGADVTIVAYDNFASCLQAFRSGKLDAFVSAENMVYDDNSITPVEKIGKEPYYICTPKNRTDLMQALDFAINTMNEQDGSFLNDLATRYEVDTSISVFLTKDERQWMQDHPSITVGYLNHYLPYCDTDSSGRPTGLLVDLLPEIFNRLPGDYAPDFTYRGYESQSDLLEALRNGVIDIIFPVGGQTWYAEQEGYLQSSSAVTIGMDLAYCGDYDASQATSRIAVNRNNLMQYYYTISNFPEAEIVFCGSIEDCLATVKKGDADSTVINALRASALLDSEKHIHIVPLDVSDTRCFGTSSDNRELLTLLNHGLSLLGSSYSTNIAYQYISGLISYSALDFIEDNAPLFLLLLLLLLFFGILAVLRKYHQHQKAAALEAARKKQLEEALQKAQQANQAKTVFLSNMSHDIRTPLNGIIGILDINTKTTDPVLLRKNQEKALEAANHLLELVNEVLEMSKLENGETVLSHETVQLPELVRQIMDIVEMQVSQAGLTISCEEDGPSCPPVYGSPLHLREIFINILGNSIKYNKKGGSIHWRTSYMQPDEEHLVFTSVITDTGIGMSREYLEHIFEPFSQEKNSARTEFQGTGLGMSIVKSLVDKMGGTIDVSSVPGSGSTFTIVIPFELSREQTVILPAPDKEATDLSGMRILLAEDNDLNLEIALYYLREAGAAVTEARNGKEAVSLFQDSPSGSFDLILMDIMMPVMNGLEASRAIRKSTKPEASSIPIIAMTANAFDEDRKSSLEAGMNDHLTKPLDAAKLIATLSKYYHPHK